MKNFKYVLFALMLAPFFMTSTGCDDEVVEPPKDTVVVVKDTAKAGMKVGFKVYELVLDKDQTDAFFTASTGLTSIFVVGYSKAGANGVVDGKGEIELSFPGNAKGKFTQANKDDIEMEVATGVAPQRSTYSWDSNSNMVIEITEYGPVGGVIKGTFSGLLKTGINQTQVDKGFFEVKRSADK